MLINMVLPGAVAEEPFAFEYSGNFTDNRVDGVGTVRLNTSGTLTVLSGKATVSVYILGAGGGCAANFYAPELNYIASGGSGGKQTVEIKLVPGTYEVVIGSGGSTGIKYDQDTSYDAIAGNGGDTIAFGITSTGGKGGKSGVNSSVAGNGGTPNGEDGVINRNANTASYVPGGSPNGGGFLPGVQPGGDGYVELTFI